MIPLLLGTWVALATLDAPSLCSRSCTCIRGAEPQTAAEMRLTLSDLDWLFTGRVLSTTWGRDSSRVTSASGDTTWFRFHTVVATLSVDSVWKGNVGERVQVKTDAESSMCGAELEVGKRYLVDGKLEPDGSIWTTSCSWTRSFQSATQFMHLLGPPVR